MKNFFRICVFEIIACIIAFLAWLSFNTSKKNYINKEILQFALETNKPLIICFWHGRIYPIAFLSKKKKNFSAIISRHNDGEIIARTIAKFGFGAIRGSTNRLPSEDKTAKNRGGSSVLKATLKALKSGENVAITPDGPKGPARKVRSNFFALASRTDAIIIPVSFSCSSAIKFSSWDSFIFPLPFSKITIIFGEKIVYDENIFKNEIDFSKRIEDELNRITDEADKIYQK